jgi:hypothetical protein
MVKKLFLSLVLAATACLAQLPQPPNNGFPSATNPDGTHFHPYDTPVFKSCITVWTQNSNGVVTIIHPANVTVHWTQSVQVLGFPHNHNNPPRPTPLLYPFNPSNTGSDGCATVTFEGEGYSGWYTLEAQPDDYFDPSTSSYYPIPKKGLNFFMMDSTVTGSTETLYEPLLPTAYLQVPTAPYDPAHFDQGRYVDINTEVALDSAASLYNKEALREFGVSDYMVVTRCSLPYGGAADNYPYNGYAAWSQPNWEEHTNGRQCDVKNPAKNGMPVRMYSLLVEVMSRNSSKCFIGKYAPGSSLTPLSDPFDYWSTQSMIHFSCGPSPLNNGKGY